MNHGFIELHAHTEYSNVRLIDCLSKLKAVVNHAVKIGLQGVAITDHECLSGHIKALNLIKEIQKTNPDFRLILGNEIYLCHNAPVSFDEKGKQKYSIESKDFFHFILLAKDAVGHSQLRLLSSRAWSRVYSYKRMERVPTFYSDIEEIVGTNPGHLIASTACLGGEFAKLALAGDAEGSAEFVQWCQKQFGSENFFIELQPGLSEEQIQFNQRAIKFCKYFDVPWIITNDVHYLTKDKRELHEIYLKSHEEEREAGDFYESTYFKTPAEMIERMEYLEPIDIAKGFENTMKIGEMCKYAGDYGLFHSTIVPQRQLPQFAVKGYLNTDPDRYPYIAKMYASHEPQDLWLMKQLEDGMAHKKQRFNNGNLSRINVELEQILKISEKLGQPVSAYYNLTQQIVEIMWSKGGSFVGCGRGSVGGWYIAYLMDIMQLNPIVHGTHWWRHLHADRPEMPDVDLDTAAYKRPRVFQATKDVFGEDHCLNIITFRTESTKAAVATACRGLGIDNDTSKELSALVPMTRGRVWSVKEMLNGNEDNGFVPIHAFVKKVAEYPMLLETISEIEGLVCGRGSHASAEIIYNQPYFVRNSLMKSPKGIETTCWDMGDSEACSALKEDYLTIEALDKMMVCMNFLLKDGLIEWQGSLKATYDKYLHPDVIDYESPGMWEAMADGKIPDLFQMQTDVGGDAIKRIRPTSMKELSLTNAVMRLSANEDMSPIDRFIAFKNDVSLWYKEMANAGLNAEEVAVLEKYLKPNYGCSIEQEDIMLLVMDDRISGFDMKWANKLRKGLAKKKKEIIDEVTAEYYRKGTELGTRKEMLDYVFKYCIKPQLG